MRLFFMVVLGVVFSLAHPAVAAEMQEIHLSIKNHAFVPAEITVPAGEKIKLVVENDDTTAAEFESADMGREKVVSGNTQVTVYVGPLDPGSYAFFDDFRRDTTTGKMIVQ